MSHQDLLTEAEQANLYLVHHMHHYRGWRGVRHELHHCFLYSEKKMSGEKYEIKHLLVAGKLYHIIDREAPLVLYDHADNEIKITTQLLANKKYFIVI